MEKKKKFYMNTVAIVAHNLQEAIHKAEALSPTWAYEYCSRVEEIETSVNKTKK